MKSEMFQVLRVAALLFILVVLLVSVGGCATTVAVDRTTPSGSNCKSKVTGLFIAHGFSIPDACNPTE